MSWWVAAVIFGGICGWIVMVAATPLLGTVATIAGTLAAGALIWSYGSLTVRADAQGLKVGAAHLEAAHIGTVTPLDRVAFRLYEKIRADIPAGKAGWGKVAELDLEKIRQAC